MVNARSVLGAVGLGLVACACGSNDPETPRQTDDQVGGRTQALTGSGVVADDVSADADIVVRVGSHCGGALITPKLVLTAAHCLYGSSDENCTAAGVTVTITTGQTQTGRTSSSRTGTAINAECHTAGLWGNDLAILVLNRSLEDVHVVRPTLEPEYLSFNPVTTVGLPIFASGWANGNGIRRKFQPSNLYFSTGEPDDPLGAWIRSDSPRVEHGDSGSPLFRMRGNVRDVIGITSGIETTGFPFYDTYDYWVDITRENPRAWLLEKVQSEVWSPFNRTTAWFTQHGKTIGDHWYGEVDYTGPCDKNRDYDCDHWDNAHDNCPFVHNEDQQDQDNDLVGDQCELCPYGQDDDPDGDGFCDTPSLDPLYTSDNCPGIANNQSNCNEKSERDRNQEIWGDACDPVPCPKTSAEVQSIEDGFVLPFNPITGGYSRGREIRDKIDSFNYAPHRIPGSGPLLTVSTTAYTSQRFCQQNLDLGYNCHSSNVTFDDQLGYAESTLTSRPWHRMRFNNLLFPRGLDFYQSYNNATQPANYWLYKDDYAYWTTNGLIPAPDSSYASDCGDPDPGNTPDGTCLKGVLWYHSNSPVGNDSTSSVGGTYVGSHGNHLSNHFMDLTPDVVYTKFYSGRGLREAIGIARSFPDPGPMNNIKESKIRPLVLDAITGRNVSMRVRQRVREFYDARTC